MLTNVHTMVAGVGVGLVVHHVSTLHLSQNRRIESTGLPSWIKVKMRHIAAYLLLQIGGKASPTAADVTKLLGTVGIEPDDERLEKLISELQGKSIADLIAEGSSKLASVPSGGAVSAPAAGGGAPAAAAAAEEKKEEEKEEKEESDEDMGFGLFD
ncbi:hypothetical protein APHAL10511_004433 [Amanita phalloides]|nr:hypothetical protein APHAL10511_004433 [Amanita phalloides]